MKILVDKMPKYPAECPHSIYTTTRDYFCNFAGNAKICVHPCNCPYFTEVQKKETPKTEELKHDNRRTHTLKIDKEYFDAVVSGNKTFEVRKNDRDYRVGDILVLMEQEHKITDEWMIDIQTGTFCRAEITYILDNAEYCKAGYVILGIKLLEQENNNE